MLCWREAGERERVWVVNPGHPIAEGIDHCIELEQSEMYGGPFAVPTPEEQVFVSWFEGGEVFRGRQLLDAWQRARLLLQPGARGLSYLSSASHSTGDLQRGSLGQTTRTQGRRSPSCSGGGSAREDHRKGAGSPPRRRSAEAIKGEMVQGSAMQAAEIPWY